MHLADCLMLLSFLPDMVRKAKSRKTRFALYYTINERKYQGVFEIFRFLYEIPFTFSLGCGIMKKNERGRQDEIGRRVCPCHGEGTQGMP